MQGDYKRWYPDMEALHHGFESGPCFVCGIVAGKNERPQHFVYEDKDHIAFLDTYPRAYGYTLVAPKHHVEQITADFSKKDYLKLQDLIYRVTEAVRLEVGAERMYVYSYGSNQGNSHVHWHVVPLPPGVPYGDQQGNWVSWSRGVLDIPQEDMASLADGIGKRV